MTVEITTSTPMDALPDIMTQEQLGAFLDVSIQTLERWRRSKSGPPFFRLGGPKRGHVRYRKVALTEWFASREMA